MDGELYLHPVHCDIPAPGGEGWLSHLKEKCSTSIEKENCGYTMFNMRKGHRKKRSVVKKKRKCHLYPNSCMGLREREKKFGRVKRAGTTEMKINQM